MASAAPSGSAPNGSNPIYDHEKVAHFIGRLIELLAALGSRKEGMVVMGVGRRVHRRRRD
jgi:hypothetical protein